MKKCLLLLFVLFNCLSLDFDEGGGILFPSVTVEGVGGLSGVRNDPSPSWDRSERAPWFYAASGSAGMRGGAGQHAVLSRNTKSTVVCVCERETDVPKRQ